MKTLAIVLMLAVASPVGSTECGSSSCNHARVIHHAPAPVAVKVQKEKVVVKEVVAPIKQNFNLFYPVGHEYAYNESVVQAERQQLNRDMERFLSRVEKYHSRYEVDDSRTRVRSDRRESRDYPEEREEREPRYEAPRRASERVSIRERETRETVSTGFVQQACSKCHTGDKAKGDFRVGPDVTLTCDEKMHAMLMVMSDEMPEKSPLSDEEKLLFMEDLARLPTAPSRGRDARDARDELDDRESEVFNRLDYRERIPRPELP